MAKEKIIKNIVEAPAVAIDESAKIAQKVIGQKPIQVMNKYFRDLGPGLVTGAADDDPSGIATYSQAGAHFGYQYLWMAVFSLPFMALVQEMCARIGMVTGRGLAGVIKMHYSKTILYTCALLLLFANTINIGADIGAMAAAANLLTNWSFSALAIGFTALSLFLQIFIPYHKYSKFLKYLTAALFAYVIAFFLVDHNWRELVRSTFVPSIHLNKDTFAIITAILGTTISPYLFFWEASQEVEVKIEQGMRTIAAREGTDAKSIKNMRTDVITGMAFSNIVMFFIVGLAGATLFKNGINDIATAADAAEALRPLAGDKAYWLFAAGVIGTGLLAVPVLAGSASYALSEAFNWNAGLGKKLKQAHGFYGVITIATVLGLLVNYIGINPMQVLIYAAVLNGLIAPVLIVMIILVASNEKIMGQWKNPTWTNVMGWLITAFMIFVGALTIIDLLGFSIL